MASASDNFNRANETPLAGNWTSFGSGGVDPAPGNPFNLTGNVVVPSVLGNDAWAYWTAFAALTDQFSQATITATDTANDGSGPGLLVRANGTYPSSSSSYRVVFTHGATQTIELLRFNAGASTLLKNFNQAWTDGDSWRLEISGYVLTIKLNGATVTTYDDTASGSKIASGAPGLGYSSTATAATLDNWSGGDLIGASAAVGDSILYSVVSGPGGFFGPLAFIEERVITAAGPLTIPQTLTGDVVAVTASMVRQVNKLATATSVAAAGTMSKLVGKLMTATSSAVTASMVRKVNKLLTAASVAVSASIATVKVKLQTMTATTVVVTASMLKQVNKLLTASGIAVTASMVRQVNKALSATAVAVTATLSTVKVKLLAMTATTVAVTASMLKQVGKPLTATTVALSAAMQRQVNKILTATTIAVTASLATLKAKFLTMTATTVSVSATMVRQVQTHLTASSVALSASLTKQVSKRLTATTSAVTAAMTTVKVKLLAMTATTVAVSASMVRRIGKTLSAASVVTGFLQAVSSAITAFFSKQFDPTVGRGHSRSNPQDSEYESDAEGNIRSDPQQRGFD